MYFSPCVRNPFSHLLEDNFETQMFNYFPKDLLVLLMFHMHFEWLGKGLKLDNVVDFGGVAPPKP